MSRLIDADAFKDYIRGACEEMKHLYKDNGAWAKEITESFCKDIDEQPTIKPVIIPCDYAKACNEATMNKITSAVAYYDALEELRKHGYVLVDLREVNNESN